MEQYAKFDFLEYVYALWRRKGLFLIVAAAVLAGSVFIIKKLPVIYRSTGTILIERQQIPEQWVNSTITSFAEERIQAISQRVLTRENLVRIIDEFNLFPDQRETLTQNEMVGLARENFSIETILRSRPVGRDSGTAAFKVSYDDASAEKARDVTNELVTLYLDENKKARTLAATDTRRFLEVEADRLERELADIEGKISKFKETYMGALPEQQDINLQAYARVEQQIANVNRSLDLLKERQIVLRSSISTARRALRESSASADDRDGLSVDPVRRLEELRIEYASLQTRYSASHPDLKRLQREIGSLESQVASSSRGAGGRSSYQDDTAIIALTTDLESAASEQDSLLAQKVMLAKKMDDLETRINEAPSVELEYQTLIRNHVNIQNKYNDIRSKQNSARVSQSLEEEQKGERFTLIEAPLLSERPYSPNFSKVRAIAIGLAFFGGLGVVFGLEFLDGTIRNVRSIESHAGVPVLVTVGYIENPKERRRRAFEVILLIILLIGIVLGGLYLMKANQISSGELYLETKEALKTIRDWVFDFESLR